MATNDFTQTVMTSEVLCVLANQDSTVVCHDGHDSCLATQSDNIPDGGSQTEGWSCKSKDW